MSHLPTPPAPFASVSMDDLSKKDRYFLMTSAIVPRPIAVVSTRGADGSENLAPFSYFNALSSEPPCLMVSITQKRGPDGKPAVKDTLRNILENREFVVHMARPEQVDLVEGASEDLEYGVNEREQLGLTAIASQWVRPSRIAEFPVAFECELFQTVDLGTNTVVIGKILGAHLAPDVRFEGKWEVDPEQMGVLGRVGRGYQRGQAIFPK